MPHLTCLYETHYELELSALTPNGGLFYDRIDLRDYDDNSDEGLMDEIKYILHQCSGHFRSRTGESVVTEVQCRMYEVYGEDGDEEHVQDFNLMMEVL